MDYQNLRITEYSFAKVIDYRYLLGGLLTTKLPRITDYSLTRITDYSLAGITDYSLARITDYSSTRIADYAFGEDYRLAT
jgi:hypothetical protein